MVAVIALMAACNGGDRTSAPTDSPSATPALTAARAVHTTTPLPDGSALVVGGCIVDGCGVATEEVAILAPNGWRAAAPLSGPRDGHTATALAGGAVLVAGGFAGEGRPALATAELYDPESGTWSDVGDLQTARGGHAAAAFGRHRVLVAGGWVGSGQYTSSTEIFDLATGSFAAGPDLPYPTDALDAVALPNGDVLVAGGRLQGDIASDVAVVIAADGTLRRVGALLQPRFKHVMVALPGGNVLVIGGTADDRVLLDSTEIFDASTETFRAGPRLVHGRYKLAGSATVLPDGRVVVAGGGTGVELIDPVQGTSRSIHADNVVRSFSTVTVIGDQVRIVGGYDERIRLTLSDLAIPLDQL